MSKKAFHKYNLIFLLLLFSFNTLPLFGNGMSEGEIHSYMCFATGVSYVSHLGYLVFPSIFTPQQGMANFLVPYYGNIFIFQEIGLGSKVGLMVTNGPDC
ncbi:hypothetical protein ACTNEO_18910 [Gracilibacillus sp. HCP3S3_G5_1]|uniref:hypothetical protein n=1 Tax=unclassified Gracilibacillus TaxID=2625209 RepID=UPI003F888FCE